MEFLPPRASPGEDPGGMPSPLMQHWDLDPKVIFLNHGSFGACPRVVQDAQSSLRRQMEREPVRFFVRELPELWRTARQRTATLVGAQAEDLAFVNNATTGVNTALCSFPLQAGDEVLITDQNYNACNNAARRWAEARGATVTQAKLPFPCPGPEAVVEAVMAAVGPKTRLAILDHVTSPTGLVLPMRVLVAALKDQGVETLVDGAHALGMLDLDLDDLGAAYYTSNAHKWLCAPKGAAMLHVRRDMQDTLRPLVTSHGMNRPVPGTSRFLTEMDWTGTDDPTPWLSLPASIDFLEGLMPGGLAALRDHNHQRVVQARALLCARLGTEPAAPEAMLGSLASVIVPGAPADLGAADPLAEALFEAGIEVPVFPWEQTRILRISAQAYNSLEDYEALAAQLAPSAL